MARRISKARFDVFVIGTRDSGACLFRELSWWSDLDEEILGTVAVDWENEFNWNILLRDEGNKFRSVYVGARPSKSFRRTEAELRLKIAEISRSENVAEAGKQYDVEQFPKSILEPAVDKSNMHPYFRILLLDESRYPARAIVTEISKWMFPADGHFIKEFQTSHFDHRLWEIYLWCALQEMRLDVKICEAPDFVCTSQAIEIDFTIEATTVGPSTTGVLANYPSLKTENEIQDFLLNYMPMKFGTPLTTKLNKVNSKNQHYWEYPDAMNRPFIIAIADFHKPGGDRELGSMIYTQEALSTYLYGHKVTWHYEQENLIIETVKVENHEYKGKVVPSGFFNLPGAENVSAILFSNAGTLAKFDRMGVCAGFAEKTFLYHRAGFKFNPDPNAAIGIPFLVEVGENEYVENWIDELQLFHNPNAKFPVPSGWFPGIMQHNFIDNQFRYLNYENRVLYSVTQITKMT